MIKLYPHQKKAIQELRTGSILCGGVGSGKSLTSLYYYFTKVCGGVLDGGTVELMKKPIDLYIITTAKKRDSLEWDEELAHFCLSQNPEYSYANINVIVDSWNNIKKYTDVKNCFFIFDEQRVVGYGAWTKSFLKITKNNKWILLTATPGDVWEDYMPVFIANGYFKNKTEFVREHVVYNRFVKYPKIDRYLGTKKLERLRNDVLVLMEYTKHTTRHLHEVKTNYDIQQYKKAMKNRWNHYKDKPLKNAGELCYYLRRIVNSDPSRILELISLLDKHDKIILFYNFDYELEMLRAMCKEIDIPYAEWNGHIHDQIPKTDKWIYLVQYTAGAEGWNCVETNVVVFFSQNYSYKTTEQASGRIDRINTKFKDLHYYKFISNASIDQAIKRSLSQKKNFNFKAFVKF